jgi:uncharacterized protein (TIGR04255 family)
VARRRDHLARAPLREALIDIQFEPRGSLQAIDEYLRGLGPAYGEPIDLWEAVVGLQAEANGQPRATAAQAVVGRRVERKNEPGYVLQCRLGGFTLSRLSPYGEWADLKGEASKLWAAFIPFVGTATVNRIAVRYINELKLPLPIRDFADFMVCPPMVPAGLPQGLSGFLTRVIIPDEAHFCTAVVTQALEPARAGGGAQQEITVVLDIDVFRLGRIQFDEADNLWAALDVLRERKNAVFFEFLTERAVEMYE